MHKNFRQGIFLEIRTFIQLLYDESVFQTVKLVFQQSVIAILVHSDR